MWGERGIYSSIAGPTVGTTVQGLAAISRGGPQMGRFALRQIPFVGSRLQRQLLKSEYQKREERELLYKMISRGYMEEAEKMMNRGIEGTVQGYRAYMKGRGKPIKESVMEWLRGKKKKKKGERSERPIPAPRMLLPKRGGGE